ncbi:MAG: ArsC/Spx/MgsR family protein [Oscillospiraceae bacterium]|jgi:arsenate reductase-like glutaredoxin family protein
MNIQIFGKPKCFDTKKAQRYFKERGVKFQNVDLSKYKISKGEFSSVRQALGSLEKLIDEKQKSQDALLLKYLSSESDKEEKLLENPTLLKTPIVRNGKQATVGYCPEAWEKWN